MDDFIEKPSDFLLERCPSLQSDSQLDNTLINENADKFDKTESSSNCKLGKELAEDNFEATDGTSYKGNSNDPETTYENPYLSQESSHLLQLGINILSKLSMRKSLLMMQMI